MKILGIIIYFSIVAWFLFYLKWPSVAIVMAIIAIVFFFVILKKRQDRLEEKFQAMFSNENIRCLDKTAVLRAVESNGYSQSQGQGYLVLTDEQLYFEMTLLDIILSIPSNSITGVSEVLRLKGVSPARLMLKIDFVNDDGENDAIALTVKDRELWMSEVHKLLDERE